MKAIIVTLIPIGCLVLAGCLGKRPETWGEAWK